MPEIVDWIREIRICSSELRIILGMGVYSARIWLRFLRPQVFTDERGRHILFGRIDLPKSGAPLTMHLRSSEDGKEKTVLCWDPASRTFTLDKGHSGIGRPEKITVPLKEDGENDIDLRILIDHSSLELFIYGGKYTVTNWIFPQPSSFFYDIFAEGGEISIPAKRIFELG
jgi:hypothetical protein